MPLAALNATAVIANDPPTAISQPVWASVRRSRLGDQDRDEARDREPEQPPGLAAEARAEQPEHAGLAAEQAAAGPARPLRPAGLAAEPPEPAVAEDQREDAVVARAGHPRARAFGGERDQHGPSAGHGHERGAAGEQLRDRLGATARRHPQVRGGASGNDQQRRGHLGLEPEADRHAGEHEPARATVRERPHDEPERCDRAEHQQRVGVVVPRDRDAHRRQREHEPGHEPAGTAEATAHEVVDQRDGCDAHQRLRHEQ
jgi:hypothetical protein